MPSQEAEDGLVEYFRCISGEHPDWDEYRQAMRTPGQVADPDHGRVLGPDRHGRLPARPRPVCLTMADRVRVRRTGGFIGRAVEGSLDLSGPDYRVPEARDLVASLDLAAAPTGKIWPDMYVVHLRGRRPDRHRPREPPHPGPPPPRRARPGPIPIVRREKHVLTPAFGVLFAADYPGQQVSTGRLVRGLRPQADGTSRPEVGNATESARRGTSMGSMAGAAVGARRPDADRPGRQHRADSGAGAWAALAAGRAWLVRALVGGRHPVEQRILEQGVRLPSSGGVTAWASLRWRGATFFDGLADGGRTVLPVPLLPGGVGNLGRDPRASVSREQFAPYEREVVAGLGCSTVPEPCSTRSGAAGAVRRAVVSIEMAVAAGLTTVEEVSAYVGTRNSWTGVPLARKAAGLAGDHSRSPQETLMKLIWRLDAGFPEPLCNRAVFDLRREPARLPRPARPGRRRRRGVRRSGSPVSRAPSSRRRPRGALPRPRARVLHGGR